MSSWLRSSGSRSWLYLELQILIGWLPDEHNQLDTLHTIFKTLTLQISILPTKSMMVKAPAMMRYHGSIGWPGQPEIYRLKIFSFMKLFDWTCCERLQVQIIVWAWVSSTESISKRSVHINAANYDHHQTKYHCCHNQKEVTEGRFISPVDFLSWV